MGYSSWNDCGSTVNESWVKKTATFLIESGLAAKGWTQVNVDEGWMLGRESATPLRTSPSRIARSSRLE